MRTCRSVKVKSIFLAAALALVLAMLAVAQAVTTELQATEIFDPLGLLGNGKVGAVIDRGTVTCPGTQPTGNPLQPCPPGSRINIRGYSAKSRWTSQSPLLTGWYYAEGNFELDADQAGRVEGTFRLELDAGGVWEGSFTGDRSKVENVNGWVVRVRGVGRGSGGSVDGMQLRFTEVGTNFGLFAVGAIDAQILAPFPSQ
jgi:hypothetical protein